MAASFPKEFLAGVVNWVWHTWGSTQSTGGRKGGLWKLGAQFCLVLGWVGGGGGGGGCYLFCNHATHLTVAGSERL